MNVLRAGSEAPLRFALTRTEVQVKTVLSEYLGNGLAYLRLSSFAENTPRDLESRRARDRRAVRPSELLGVVLDLRSNPGGVLDAAVQVADTFIPDGMIVSGTGRVRQARFEEFAHAGDLLESVPTVVRRERRLGLRVGDRRRRAAGSRPRARSSASAPTARVRCRR